MFEEIQGNWNVAPGKAHRELGKLPKKSPKQFNLLFRMMVANWFPDQIQSAGFNL